ncbi:unnamed protein product [Amoebophrya sp. A120]|nr:unnamed protein product [Amoebophrya sp. A120]CAD7976104.1 unnamed protein product [Amoebophrya sp. A120]|eukprot:GSA120T00026305001.1
MMVNKDKHRAKKGSARGTSAGFLAARVASITGGAAALLACCAQSAGAVSLASGAASSGAADGDTAMITLRPEEDEARWPDPSFVEDVAFSEYLELLSPEELDRVIPRYLHLRSFSAIETEGILSGLPMQYRPLRPSPSTTDSSLFRHLLLQELLEDGAPAEEWTSQLVKDHLLVNQRLQEVHTRIDKETRSGRRVETDVEFEVRRERAKLLKEDRSHLQEMLEAKLLDEAAAVGGVVQNTVPRNTLQRRSIIDQELRFLEDRLAGELVSEQVLEDYRSIRDIWRTGLGDALASGGEKARGLAPPCQTPDAWKEFLHYRKDVSRAFVSAETLEKRVPSRYEEAVGNANIIRLRQVYLTFTRRLLHLNTVRRVMDAESIGDDLQKALQQDISELEMNTFLPTSLRETTQELKDRLQTLSEPAKRMVVVQLLDVQFLLLRHQETFLTEEWVGCQGRWINPLFPDSRRVYAIVPDRISERGFRRAMLQKRRLVDEKLRLVEQDLGMWTRPASPSPERTGGRRVQTIIYSGYDGTTSVEYRQLDICIASRYLSLDLDVVRKIVNFVMQAFHAHAP